jgi:hypothetical protein
MNPTDDQLETSYLAVSIMAVIEAEIDKIVDGKTSRNLLGKKIACSWCETSMKFKMACWDKDMPLCSECYGSAFWNHGDQMPFTDAMEFKEEIPVDVPLPSEVAMDPRARIKNMSCERCRGPIMSSNHAHWFGHYPTCRACFDLSIKWNGADEGPRPYTDHEKDICILMDRMLDFIEGMKEETILSGEMEKLLKESFWFKENPWNLMVCHNAIGVSAKSHPCYHLLCSHLNAWYRRISILSY